MARILDVDYPDDLFYDMENQIWYAAEPGGTVRAGFTPWAVGLIGDVLVFTPKRTGLDFEKDRWIAMVEGGKWVGAARAGFDGTVLGHNERLVDAPELMMKDAFGEGWMMRLRPARDDWRDGLVTGEAIGPAFDAWLLTGAYKDRSE
ncbi:glycine cleavage system protein H [Rhodoplanes azumiensis]|uniref:Glycine cleavage system protein H n=1 Tax=Rhodoplanes azumiensis TaxID=1897628 RepID=A0ABW5AL26_9BRAD